MTNLLKNYINGSWKHSSAAHCADVINPATGQLIATVPLSPAAEIDEAAQAASHAFIDWRRTPAGNRIQYLFRLKSLLEAHEDELARLITDECGKTYPESAAEI